MSQTSRAELIRDLRQRIRQVERAHQPAARERVGEWESESALTLSLSHSSTLSLSHMVDRPGALIEWLSDGEGTGAATLALALTPRLLENGGALVVIDSRREFYPPAAAALGVPLEQMVIARPASARDALWAWEQSLRSGAAAVVLGWAETLHDRAIRRLQLAAEAGSSLGFLLRPASCRATPSWAEVRLLVEAVPRPHGDKVTRWQGDKVKMLSSVTLSPPHLVPLSSSVRRLRLEVLHCRGGTSGQILELELSDEADPVRLAPRLADPASTARTARA